MTAESTQLSGILNLAAMPALLAQADALAAAGRVDLRAVTSVDSSGLSLLLELTRRAKLRGATLVFDGASRQIRELAQFFQAEDLLTFGD